MIPATLSPSSKSKMPLDGISVSIFDSFLKFITISGASICSSCVISLCVICTEKIPLSISDNLTEFTESESDESIPNPLNLSETESIITESHLIVCDENFFTLKAVEESASGTA